MPASRHCVLVLASLWALPAKLVPTLPAVEAKPLRRTFHAGEESHYRVRLMVRRELEVPETVDTGAATSVKTVEHWAESRLSWIVSERVLSVGPDGAARIREQIAGCAPPIQSQQANAGDAQSAKLAASLEQTLSEWAHSRTLEFRVGVNGTTSEVAADGAPKLDESTPPLLTLWLGHALRPQATLPDRPVRPGESWQEPRRLQMAGWVGVQAGETDEWLEADAGNRAAVRLRVVQEITGRVLDNPAAAARARAKGEDLRETPPPTSSKTERFHGESMSTIALDDGHVIAASRSARRETVQELPPAEGAKEARQSRATLSVQVEIEPCVEGQCEAGGNR
jgi:hypothetical protein